LREIELDLLEKRENRVRNRHHEVLARSINLLLGRAAFETAKRLYPKDRVEYRKGAQVIERSGGEEG
jgi:hypothetical protein